MIKRNANFPSENFISNRELASNKRGRNLNYSFEFYLENLMEISNGVNSSTNTTRSSVLAMYMNYLQKQLSLSLSVMLVIGFLGNLVSFIIFRRQNLRRNAMALLFSASSIFNILVLVFGIGTSLYAVDRANPETTSATYCKLRGYIRHVLLMSVRGYIILACAASFALSSPKHSTRILCQTKFVKTMIIIVPLLSIVIAAHIPIWTTLQQNRCVMMDSYVIVYAIYFLLVVGIIPVVLMAFFILLTSQNLKKLHFPADNPVHVPVRIRRKDQQFIRMLASLVIMYVVTNIYFPANTFYMSVTYWTDKNPDRIFIESIIFSITSNYILYINNISPFFLFLLSSSTFRKSLRELLMNQVLGLVMQQNRIQPGTTTVSSL